MQHTLSQEVLYPQNMERFPLFLALILFLPVFVESTMEAPEGGMPDNSDMTPGLSKTGSSTMENNKRYLRMKNTLPKRDAAPIIVHVHLSLESIRDVSGQATIDLYMTEFWKDHREVFQTLKQSDANYTEMHDQSIRMSGPGVVNYCWIPDTYFILARSIYYSPSSLSLQVTPDGSVVLDRKVRLVTPCKPQVKFFPFDITTCRILISSYGFDATELYLVWEKDEKGEGVSFPFQYEPLSEMGFKILNMNSTCFYAVYSTLTFTILEGVVPLERLYTVYIYQIYIPAALLVLLSWVTFWINKGATPARASVGVTTVLTMLTLATQSQQNMEKHITLETSLLDVYIWVCFSFVIAAIFEFAMSDFLNERASREKNKEKTAQREKSQEEKTIRKTTCISNCTANTALLNGTPTQGHIPLEVSLAARLPRKKAPAVMLTNKIDKIARVLFPVVFFTFNVLYWSYVAYILMNNNEGDRPSNRMSAVPCRPPEEIFPLDYDK